MVETLERRQMLAAAPIQFTDTDGDQVTLRLTGPGTLEMNPANRFVLASQTKVNSVLNISVRRAPGGDGIVRLGELRLLGPMRAIIGPQAEITHEITINDLQEPVSPRHKVSVNLGVLIGLAVYTGGQHVGTFKLADWSPTELGSELNAPTVGSIVVTGRKDVAGTPADESRPGNLGAILILGDDSTKPTDWSVRSVRVAGTIGDIQATGRVGSVTAGEVSGQIAARTITSIATKAVSGASGDIMGSIGVTGLPGVTTSLGKVSAAADISAMTITSQQGNIGPISAGGEIVGSTIVSAGNISSVSAGEGLGASRVQSLGSIGTVRAATLGDAVVQVGVAPTFTGIATAAGSFANPAARLGSFVMTKHAGAAADEPQATPTNTVSAARIGTMSLRNVDSAASLQVYAVEGPTLVTYSDTMTQGANFVWRAGRPMPDLLTGMLHDR